MGAMLHTYILHYDGVCVGEWGGVVQQLGQGCTATGGEYAPCTPREKVQARMQGPPCPPPAPPNMNPKKWAPTDNITQSSPVM